MKGDTLMVCPRQIDCPHFQWKRKARNEHVRRTELCLIYKDGCMEQHDIKQGPACNIDKIKRIKEVKNEGR